MKENARCQFGRSRLEGKDRTGLTVMQLENRVWQMSTKRQDARSSLFFSSLTIFFWNAAAKAEE